MNHVKCSCCGASSEPHRAVNCAICKKSYKIECVDISSAEARKIHSNVGLTWSCTSCSQLGNDLNGLKAAIVVLQDEIKTLKTAVALAPSTTRLPLLETERIIQEIADRDNRKTNVIVYGMSESCKSSNEQSAADKVALSELFSVIGVTDPPTNPQRLGKFDPTQRDRVRPIKVQLSSASSVLSAIKNSSKIRGVVGWNNVRISRDQTLMQRDLYREIRREMQDRLDRGESNLKIKYKNGVPHIVSSENHQRPTARRAV